MAGKELNIKVCSPLKLSCRRTGNYSAIPYGTYTRPLWASLKNSNTTIIYGKMILDEFKKNLKTAAENGTLMTPKHDPYNLGTIYSSFRTVLSYDLADNLERFIKSGNYSVKKYENKMYPDSPNYFEITPNADSGFSIPSSGVTANSIFASTTVDKIVAISGKTSGWHIFGEDSSIINTKIKNGDLIFLENLT